MGSLLDFAPRPTHVHAWIESALFTPEQHKPRRNVKSSNAPASRCFGYTYNPVGNILQILDQVTPSENRSHTYDALQRLKTGGTTGTAESYTYDLVGNRTTSFLSSSHNHDDRNRLLEDDAFTYTYDNNGNLQTKTNKSTSQVTTYHWDAQDQLIQIDRPNSTTVTYKYDGLGRRIEKNVAGSITGYVYDGEDILLEYDGMNTFRARYSHGDQVDQPLMLQKTGVGFFYYHSNHQGSITHLTNSSGTVANSYVYDSYGRRLSVFESVIQPYSYTGREYDVESGLYFYRARYFDAQTGRFLSEDPIGFNAGDQNLYRYVFNNPVNFADPDGERVDFSKLFPPLIDFGKGVLEGFFGSTPGDIPKTPQTPFKAAGKTVGEKSRSALQKESVKMAFEKFKETTKPDPNFKEPGCRGGICPDIPDNSQPAPPERPSSGSSCPKPS